MNNPLVSVLIPVYNRVKLVGASIDSALKQTYKNIEIVIVDNCSSDGTWELLEEYEKKDKRIRIYRNDKNIGPVRNWKRCIEESKGEYAKILFSDDLIDENYVEEVINNFDDNTAFVLSAFNVFNDTGVIYSSKYNTLNKISTKFYLEDILVYNIYELPVSPGCAIFRTEDLKESIEANEPNKYGAGNDLRLFLDTVKKYNFVRTTNDTKAHFRAHKDSFTISKDLKLYYDLAKLSFIDKYSIELKQKFMTVQFLKRLRKGHLNHTLIASNERIDLLFAIRFIVNKTLFKFKRNKK